MENIDRLLVHSHCKCLPMSMSNIMSIYSITVIFHLPPLLFTINYSHSIISRAFIFIHIVNGIGMAILGVRKRQANLLNCLIIFVFNMSQKSFVSTTKRMTMPNNNRGKVDKASNQAERSGKTRKCEIERKTPE